MNDRRGFLFSLRKMIGIMPQMDREIKNLFFEMKKHYRRIDINKGTDYELRFNLIFLDEMKLSYSEIATIIYKYDNTEVKKIAKKFCVEVKNIVIDEKEDYPNIYEFIIKNNEF